MDGVIRYEIDENEKSLSITFDDKITTQEQLIEQLSEQGYQIAGQKEGSGKGSCP